MSNFSETDRDSASMPERPLMDDLPPVQPPSAGFIVQLFIFPALIVMGIVAIWAMFGLIAVGEQDWRKLVQELHSPNSHIRNRAMYGLAQLLEQDSRRGELGQHLKSNREIAQGFADLLMTEFRKNSTSREGVDFQEYLTRALGMMDALDITAPALCMAMEPQRDVDIRKLATYSVSEVAGRQLERNETPSSHECVDALIQLSADQLPVLRQCAGYALGLFDSPESNHQLEVLLENNDQMTRVNATIGLARHGSTKGFRVICDSLKFNDEMLVRINGDDRTTIPGEQFLIVKNLLKVVTDLAKRFDDVQRRQLIPLVEELANRHAEIRIQLDASAALNKLKMAMTDAPG